MKRDITKGVEELLVKTEGVSFSLANIDNISFRSTNSNNPSSQYIASKYIGNTISPDAIGFKNIVTNISKRVEEKIIEFKKDLKESQLS